MASQHSQDDNTEDDDDLLATSMEEIEEGNRGHLFEFQLTPGSDRRVRRFGVRRRVFDATLHPRTDLLHPPHVDGGYELERALTRAVDREIHAQQLDDDDHVLFTLQHPTFTHAFQSFHVPVREWHEQSQRVTLLLQKMAEKLNSNEQFQPDDRLKVQLTTVQHPGTGSGRRQENTPGHIPLASFLMNKTSVIKVRNRDELCCARAIVTMQAWADEQSPQRCTPPISYRILKQGKDGQTQLAKALHAAARVPEGPCGLGALEQFQIVLPDYFIKVISAEMGFQVIFGHGEKQSHQRYVLLLKHNHHYYGLKSLSGFFGRSYYCHTCDKGYDHESFQQHPCTKRRCIACKQKDCRDYQTILSNFDKPPRPTQVTCLVCNRCFYGSHCEHNHLTFSLNQKSANSVDQSVCSYLQKCKTCCKALDWWKNRGKRRRPHVCETFMCKTCKEFDHVAHHRCFMQPVVDPDPDDSPPAKQARRAAHAVHFLAVNESSENEEEEEENAKPKLPPYFVYADYECTQDDQLHVPILICAKGQDHNDTLPALVFYGRSCTEQFYDWLLTKTEVLDEPREVIVIFHNFKGYDGMFILQFLYDQRVQVKDQICVGSKILSLKAGRLTFKDSLCFLPFGLSAFASTFNLTETKKGFFPHFFNTEANQKYVGSWPEAKYYDPDGMKPDMRKAFDAWYKTVQHREFNLHEEMIAYCQSDVNVLKAGCEIFQREFAAKADFNPMDKCVTIASACMRYYRKKHLPAQTLALEPPYGWNGKRGQQSLKAYQWLEWQQSQQITGRIQHAFNGGEQTLQAGHHCYQVDGFNATTQTVYEFHGCLWHGCPKCFAGSLDKTTRLHPDRTKWELFEATMQKQQQLRSAGYHVVTCWECQWNQLRQQPDIVTFLSTRTLSVPSLNPRDAFFGGRTNAVHLWHEIEEEEEIRYVDVTSLYPTVNKYDEYPIGHPMIIVAPSHRNIHRFFGIADCTVLPPEGLFHPVLPYRCKNKITFPLCQACVEEELPKRITERTWLCEHDNTQRSIRGTWCTPELCKAVEKGYQILCIHEVYHFSPTQRRQGLFKEYVNVWLKGKTEASGWPPNADGSLKTPEQQSHFLSQYTLREGIQLDPINMIPNKGKKATSKLALNSFWGKFGEQENKRKIQQITTAAALYDYMKDKTITIHDLRILNDDCLEISYDKLIDDAPGGQTTNIFIAAFTTCHARLRLYHHLDHVGENALYFDTDSVVYKWRPGEPEIPLGNFLGDMTDELDDGKGNRDVIVEFVSCGPKNYAYRTRLGKTEVKIRGFTLNIRGQQQLHFDSMKNTLFRELRNPLRHPRTVIVPNPHFIQRNKQTKTLTTVQRDKQWSVVYDKRVLANQSSFRTLPYGFSWLHPEEDEDTIPE